MTKLVEQPGVSTNVITGTIDPASVIESSLSISLPKRTAVVANEDLLSAEVIQEPEISLNVVEFNADEDNIASQVHDNTVGVEIKYDEGISKFNMILRENVLKQSACNGEVTIYSTLFANLGKLKIHINTSEIAGFTGGFGMKFMGWESNSYSIKNVDSTPLVPDAEGYITLDFSQYTKELTGGFLTEVYLIGIDAGEVNAAYRPESISMTPVQPIWHKELMKTQTGEDSVDGALRVAASAGYATIMANDIELIYKLRDLVMVIDPDIIQSFDIATRLTCDEDYSVIKSVNVEGYPQTGGGKSMVHIDLSEYLYKDPDGLRGSQFLHSIRLQNIVQAGSTFYSHIFPIEIFYTYSGKDYEYVPQY